MKKVLKHNITAGSRGQNEPRRLSEILSECLASVEPLAAAARKHHFETFYPNTEVGVDLKLMTREPGRMKPGRNYKGMLLRDVECEEFRYADHYTFMEALPTAAKRNPHVYVGRYITITRRDDGTLRPNFRPMPDADKDFSPERYAMGVANELLWALEGLVEK